MSIMNGQPIPWTLVTEKNISGKVPGQKSLGPQNLKLLDNLEVKSHAIFESHEIFESI